MSDWDYEDDWESQQAVDRGCAKIRQANDLLNEAHKEIKDSLHEEGILEILSELQVTKEITLDMERSYFRRRHQEKLAWMMSLSDFVETSMNKRRKKYDD